MKKYNPIFSIAACAILITAASITAIKIMDKSQKNTLQSILRSEMTIEDGRMTPEMLLSLGRISDPQASPDGKHILYGVSYTSIGENRSQRHLFIADADGSNASRLTDESKSISNARWCDSGRRIAFIMGGQIWSAKVKQSKDGWKLGRKICLSDIPAGTGEFSISPDESKVMYVSSVKSSVKSPADIYEDLDKADAICTGDLMYRHWDHWVKEIPHTFIAPFDAKRKAGITPSSSKDILENESGLYELPTEPFGGIEQLSWSPDGRFIAYSCRKEEGKRYAFSTNTEIYIYDTESGNTVLIPMKGGYDTDPVWSPDGKKLCWISMERDGYEADKQRLIIAEIAPDALAAPKSIGSWLKNVYDITEDFKYNVSGPVWNGNGEIYFNSLAEGIQGIFRASLDLNTATAPEIGADKTGTNPLVAEIAASRHPVWTIERITGEDLWYDFSSPFNIISDEKGTTLYASWCSMNFPSELISVRINGANSAVESGCEVHSTPLRAECNVTSKAITIKQITNENGHLLSQLKDIRTEARMIRTVDGKDMLTWVLYPSDFTPEKVYPAIEICLGGPQGTLSQSWSYRWNYRLMADQGYIVVLPNRRGTTAFGQEWTEQISGDYCGLNIQDYLSAARALKAEPYIQKMAACGASYGGYSVYYLCGVHGDTFDAFIAHAGIFNEEHMYLTTEEMWFPNWDNGGIPDECTFDPRVGTPECPVGPAGDGKTFGGILQSGSPWSTAPKAVRHYANSPHKLVTNWHTPLMVIHGGIDFRVPVDEGMAAYNAAQMMGVPSKLLIFPDENHWILKPQNALFWHREYFSWLDRWTK